MTRIRVASPPGGFQKAFSSIKDPIASAATAAVREAGELALSKGRADIAAAGFGPDFQKGLTANFRPTNGAPSLKASALLYHRIPYAVVFEEGYQIRGKPLLWIPLAGARVGGQPPRLGDRGNVADKLFTIKRPGKAPLLARKGADGKAQFLFVGVPVVNIRKRLHLHDDFDQAANALPELFDKHLKVD